MLKKSAQNSCQITLTMPITRTLTGTSVVSPSSSYLSRVLFRKFFCILLMLMLSSLVFIHKRYTSSSTFSSPSSTASSLTTQNDGALRMQTSTHGLAMDLVGGGRQRRRPLAHQPEYHYDYDDTAPSPGHHQDIAKTEHHPNTYNEHDYTGPEPERHSSDYYYQPHEEVPAAGGHHQATSEHHPYHQEDKENIPKHKEGLIVDIVKTNLSEECTQAAFKEFPPDLFGHKWRVRGFILVHILVVLYMFYSLAVVCDLYFLPALGECSSRLGLSDDVAGATFMAAGSSAPELFTAILGVFVAKGDVGTGTIVGSAVFNILFVIGLCGLYTVCELNWWPVIRDSLYYMIAVLLLILFIHDGKVTTIESSVMLLFYGGYIALMKYNLLVRDLLVRFYEAHLADKMGGLLGSARTDHESFDMEEGGRVGPKRGFGGKITFYEAANLVIVEHKRLFTPRSRFRATGYLVLSNNMKARSGGRGNRGQLDRTESRIEAMRRMSTSIEETEQHFWKVIPNPTAVGALGTLKWVVRSALHAVLHYTIPDTRKRPQLFLVAFAVSILWLAFFSYIMVWMVSIIGFTFDIPDSIMGITFLAAGTSVPDAYASIHVAKQGHVDMAVSNSIGSNVFDILVGLALPWFIQTAIIYPGSYGEVNSRGMVFAVLLLLISLIIAVLLIHRNHWVLNPTLSIGLLATYVAFLLICGGLEFNLFGYVNAPMCPEPDA